MSNVSISGPIIAFHDDRAVQSDVPATSCPEYLRRRETAERAAAKSSATIAGRRAHQELAELIHAARTETEAAREPNGTEGND